MARLFWQEYKNFHNFCTLLWVIQTPLTGKFIAHWSKILQIMTWYTFFISRLFLMEESKLVHIKLQYSAWNHLVLVLDTGSMWTTKNLPPRPLPLSIRHVHKTTKKETCPCPFFVKWIIKSQVFHWYLIHFLPEAVEASRCHFFKNWSLKLKFPIPLNPL